MPEAARIGHRRRRGGWGSMGGSGTSAGWARTKWSAACLALFLACGGRSQLGTGDEVRRSGQGGQSAPIGSASAASTQAASSAEGAGASQGGANQASAGQGNSSGPSGNGG